LFLSRVRKRVRLVSATLLLLMALNSQTTQFFGEFLARAFAATPDSITTPLSFSYGGASLVGDKYYSSNSYLSGGNINVTVPTGKVISKIFHGSQDVTPPAAIGRNSYSGLVNDITGSIQTVSSLKNATGTQGYYAWYRYKPGASQGQNWYADVSNKQGNSVKISCGPSDFGPATHHRSSGAPTESINGFDMPIVPGCSSLDFGSDLEALSLGAWRDSDKPYLLSG
jgi:hypothetical protein